MTTREHLQAAGERSGQDYFAPGMREGSEVIPCRKCEARVRVGLDSDIAAFRAVVEVHPLDLMGEFFATVQGLRTYAHVMRGKRWVLRGPRSAGQIALNPANTLMVHAEHVCGQMLGKPLEPRMAKPFTDLDQLLLPCMGCGLPAVTSVCSACRVGVAEPRPIVIERSETNEADVEAGDA